MWPAPSSVNLQRMVKYKRTHTYKHNVNERKVQQQRQNSSLFKNHRNKHKQIKTFKIGQKHNSCRFYLHVTALCRSKLRQAFPHQQWELSTKLVLNAVSTGAHVLKGKVYQNHMIDVQVTNSKLYRRASRLLQVRKKKRKKSEKRL